MSIVTLQLAHTADLAPAALESARELLYDVFRNDMTEEDWDHALGGIHALAWEGNRLIGHASVVLRRLLHQGRAFRTGYVEAVAVRADRRRRGHASAMMEALERVVRGGYEVGALAADRSAVPLYAGRGWKRWEGPTSMLTPIGIERTPDEDGGIYVLPVTGPLDLYGELTCDWRDGDAW